jgi:hypothetical protein
MQRASVVIATKNRKVYLLKAVESAMAQRGLLGGGDEGCAGEGNPWRCACEQDLDAEQGKSGSRKAAQ